MANLGWGLQITVLGMGLVFGLLALLWGLLTLVLRLDRPPSAGAAADGESPANIESEGAATATLTNNGSGPLTISQNGITLPAGPFTITGITSSTQGAISLSGSSKTIAAGNAETWTIGLRFDPTVTGLLQQPLTILSDDADSSTTKR